ncbi:MAG: helix-turn-helix domain-containing protein [Paludibacteraceae bacterium]|nr:helix-turn-helix domain-containing protein [Paludibacteraceae bacterium]
MNNTTSNDLSYQLLLRISQILDKKQMSQTELANRLGKAPSAVSRWFKGEHNFNLATIQAISEALDEPLIYVVNDTLPVETYDAATSSPTNTKLIAPRRKYTRKCPVSIHRFAECNAPNFSTEHRQALASSERVQEMREVNRLRALDQADPNRWALWQHLYKRFVSNVSKHGSETRYTKNGNKMKVAGLRYFVENQFRAGHPLLYHFPELATLTPAEVLAKLTSH